MAKLRPWPTIKQVPILIERVKGRVDAIKELIQELTVKRVSKRAIAKGITTILKNEEDLNLLKSLIYCHNCSGTQKFPSKLISEIEHASSDAYEQYEKIINLNDARFESILGHLKQVVIESDSELITKSMEGLNELYSIALKHEADTKSGQELCFTAFQTAAGLYRYLENKENSFLKQRLGINESELSVLNLASAIKEEAKDVFQQFLGNSNKSVDEIHFMGDLKLRKSFKESKKVVTDFFDEVHPEFGKIARKVLSEGLIVDHKAETLFAIDAYGSLPRIIVKPASRLKDEVGLVHELAHAIHFSLTNTNNPITNTHLNTLLIEYVPCFFELLFLFSEFKKAKTPRSKKALLNYIFHYFTCQFYSRTFSVEVENLLWLELGESIKSPKDLSRAYHRLMKDYYGGIIEINDAHKHGWIYHHCVFDPQLELSYLLSFIYGYHSFIRYQSFRMTPESLRDFLSKGSDADLDSIFPLHDFLENPEQYIKEIIDSLAEYNREN